MWGVNLDVLFEVKMTFRRSIMLLAEGVCRFETAIKYNLKVDKMRRAGLCPVKPEDAPLKEANSHQRQNNIVFHAVH